MKKIVSITLALAALVLGLASCDNGTTSSVGSGSGGKDPLLKGYYEVWGNTNFGKYDTSTDAWISKSWKDGDWFEAKSWNFYFEGDKYWELFNDKMTAGGTSFSYTKTHITLMNSTQRYTVIEKDTIFFHMMNDDTSGLSSGASHLLSRILRKTNRKGHIERINGTPTFIDD